MSGKITTIRERHTQEAGIPPEVEECPNPDCHRGLVAGEYCPVCRGEGTVEIDEFAFADLENDERKAEELEAENGKE